IVGLAANARSIAASSVSEPPAGCAPVRAAAAKAIASASPQRAACRSVVTRQSMIDRAYHGRVVRPCGSAHQAAPPPPTSANARADSGTNLARTAGDVLAPPASGLFSLTHGFPRRWHHIHRHDDE